MHGSLYDVLASACGLALLIGGALTIRGRGRLGLVVARVAAVAVVLGILSDMLLGYRPFVLGVIVPREVVLLLAILTLALQIMTLEILRRRGVNA